MRKTIIPIILGIVLISLVSAMYSGECLQVDLSSLESLDNVVYDIIGNSSNLEGLTIDLNETTKNVSICTVINYKPDNFTLIFIDNSTKEIIKEVHHYSSGGSSGGSKTKWRTKYIDRKIIKYIDKEIVPEVEDIVLKPTPKPKKYYLKEIVSILLLIFIIILLKFIIKLHRKSTPKDL